MLRQIAFLPGLPGVDDYIKEFIDRRACTGGSFSLGGYDMARGGRLYRMRSHAPSQLVGSGTLKVQPVKYERVVAAAAVGSQSGELLPSCHRSFHVSSEC